MGTRIVNVLLVPGMGVPYALQVTGRQELRRIVLSDWFVHAVKTACTRFVSMGVYDHLNMVIAVSFIGDGTCYPAMNMAGFLKAIDAAIYYLEVKREIQLPTSI